MIKVEFREAQQLYVWFIVWSLTCSKIVDFTIFPLYDVEMEAEKVFMHGYFEISQKIFENKNKKEFDLNLILIVFIAIFHFGMCNNHVKQSTFLT